ncbi:hypothetical protein Tco_1338943 [Tanacetum coccineum]
MNLKINKEGFFARKVYCIKTKLEDNILEKFKIIVRGKIFVIRAKELFVWFPTFNDNKEVDDYSEDDSVNGAEEINGDISEGAHSGVLLCTSVYLARVRLKLHFVRISRLDGHCMVMGDCNDVRLNEIVWVQCPMRRWFRFKKKLHNMKKEIRYGLMIRKKASIGRLVDSAFKLCILTKLLIKRAVNDDILLDAV